MALQQDPFADAWAMVEAEKELQERLSDWFTGVKQKKHCNGNDGNGCSMNIFCIAKIAGGAARGGAARSARQLAR